MWWDTIDGVSYAAGSGPGRLALADGDEYNPTGDGLPTYQVLLHDGMVTINLRSLTAPVPED